jgi:hypothetical protein
MESTRCWGVGIVIALMIIGSCSHEQKILRAQGFVAKAGASILEQTRQHWPVEYDSSGVGAYVRSIDRVPQTRTSFWLYFVNRKPGQISCDQFVPEAGDTIEWRLVENL